MTQGIKVCKKCGIEKDESLFRKRRSVHGRSYYGNICQACDRGRQTASNLAQEPNFDIVAILSIVSERVQKTRQFVPTCDHRYALEDIPDIPLLSALREAIAESSTRGRVGPKRPAPRLSYMKGPELDLEGIEKMPNPGGPHSWRHAIKETYRQDKEAEKP